MEIGSHFRVLFHDNTVCDGVLEGAGPIFLKFFSLDDGRHFLVPIRAIKRLDYFDDGPEEGPGDDDDDDFDPDDDDDEEMELPLVCPECERIL